MDMDNIFDKLDYTENGFVMKTEIDEKQKEALKDYIERMTSEMENSEIRREAAKFLEAYTYGANDVLNIATTVFYNLFKAMLTVGLEEGSEQHSKMEEDAIRHTKGFRNMIVELSKIKAI